MKIRMQCKSRTLCPIPEAKGYIGVALASVSVDEVALNLLNPPSILSFIAPPDDESFVVGAFYDVTITPTKEAT